MDKELEKGLNKLSVHEHTADCKHDHDEEENQLPISKNEALMRLLQQHEHQEQQHEHSHCCCSHDHTDSHDHHGDHMHEHSHHHHHNQYIVENKFADKTKFLVADELEIDGITYTQYKDETQLSLIMDLITRDLSEPYSIYTYRYFIYNWPFLCFLVTHRSFFVLFLFMGFFLT